jgi:hypothetical protein
VDIAAQTKPARSPSMPTLSFATLAAMVGLGSVAITTTATIADTQCVRRFFARVASVNVLPESPKSGSADQLA